MNTAILCLIIYFIVALFNLAGWLSLWYDAAKIYCRATGKRYGMPHMSGVLTSFIPFFNLVTALAMIWHYNEIIEKFETEMGQD